MSDGGRVRRCFDSKKVEAEAEAVAAFRDLYEQLGTGKKKRAKDGVRRCCLIMARIAALETAIVYEEILQGYERVPAKKNGE